MFANLFKVFYTCFKKMTHLFFGFIEICIRGYCVKICVLCIIIPTIKISRFRLKAIGPERIIEILVAQHVSFHLYNLLVQSGKRLAVTFKNVRLKKYYFGV